MHAATGITTLLLLLLQYDFREQSSVVKSSSSFFGSPFSIYVNTIPLLRTAVFRVSRECLPFEPCNAWSAFKPFFRRQSSVWCGSGLLRRERHKSCINILTDMIQCLAESRKSTVKSMKRFSQ